VWSALQRATSTTEGIVRRILNYLSRLDGFFCIAEPGHGYTSVPATIRYAHLSRIVRSANVGRNPSKVGLAMEQIAFLHRYGGG
jgi:hypothetical protein